MLANITKDKRIMTSTAENNISIPTGHIEVICGSMFSGKTEELISRLKVGQKNKKKVIGFKPDVDSRYHDSDIVSHNQNKFKSQSVKNPNEIIKLSLGCDVIGIDEIQFFNHEIIKVCNELANKGKIVIVAGLDMDFLGRPFSCMPQIMALAEKVLKMHARCNDCGCEANHTFRKGAKKELIQIGEKSDYLALCRNCFNTRLKINE